MRSLVRAYRLVVNKLQTLDSVPPLLARLSVGSLFIVTGWGKLHDIDKIIGFFTELGIPFPEFQAHLVATTEFVGGLLIVFGLFTRLAAIPLSITMIVAIITAKKADINNVTDLLGLDEFVYFVIFLWFIISGPGKISIDHFLKKKFD